VPPIERWAALKGIEMVRTFKFVGNGKNDPTSCNAWGYEFIYDRAVAVNDPHAIKKLEGNSHFEEVTDMVSMRSHEGITEEEEVEAPKNSSNRNKRNRKKNK